MMALQNQRIKERNKDKKLLQQTEALKELSLKNPEKLVRWEPGICYKLGFNISQQDQTRFFLHFFNMNKMKVIPASAIPPN